MANQHSSHDGGRDATATLDQPAAELRELLLGLAYPGSPAGSIERRDAGLAALRRLEEQYGTLAAVLREIPAMEREGYNAKQLADYVTAALEQASIPATDSTSTPHDSNRVESAPAKSREEGA